MNQEQIIRAWDLRGFPLLHLEHAAALQSGPWDRVMFDLMNKINGPYTGALIGIRGCGKTQIATSVAINGGLGANVRSRPRYSRASGVFRALRSSFRKESKSSEEEVMDSFITPSILVIDEAQERGETDHEDRTLSEIIDLRYMAKRATLILANLTVQSVGESLGSSAVSRIKECGDVIVCNWPSFREKKP